MALCSNPLNPPVQHEQVPAKVLSKEHLKPVADCIYAELRALRAEREAILKRIGMIKQTIVGLSVLFGQGVINDDLQRLLSCQPSRRHRTHSGLTDFCRQLLSASHSDPLTLPEICLRVRQECPALLADHKRPAASLRVVLRRLVIYGEAVEVLSDKGLIAWKAATVPRMDNDLADSHPVVRSERG